MPGFNFELLTENNLNTILVNAGIINQADIVLNEVRTFTQSFLTELKSFSMLPLTAKRQRQELATSIWNRIQQSNRLNAKIGLFLVTLIDNRLFIINNNVGLAITCKLIADDPSFIRFIPVEQTILQPKPYSEIARSAIGTDPEVIKYVKVSNEKGSNALSSRDIINLFKEKYTDPVWLKKALTLIPLSVVFKSQDSGIEIVQQHIIGSILINTDVCSVTQFEDINCHQTMMILLLVTILEANISQEMKQNQLARVLNFIKPLSFVNGKDYLDIYKSISDLPSLPTSALKQLDSFEETIFLNNFDIDIPKTHPSKTGLEIARGNGDYILDNLNIPECLERLQQCQSVYYYSSTEEKLIKDSKKELGVGASIYMKKHSPKKPLLFNNFQLLQHALSHECLASKQLNCVISGHFSANDFAPRNILQHTPSKASNRVRVYANLGQDNDEATKIIASLVIQNPNIKKLHLLGCVTAEAVLDQKIGQPIGSFQPKTPSFFLQDPKKEHLHKRDLAIAHHLKLTEEGDRKKIISGDSFMYAVYNQIPIEKRDSVDLKGYTSGVFEVEDRLYTTHSSGEGIIVELANARNTEAKYAMLRENRRLTPSDYKSVTFQGTFNFERQKRSVNETLNAVFQACSSVTDEEHMTDLLAHLHTQLTKMDTDARLRVYSNQCIASGAYRDQANRHDIKNLDQLIARVEGQLSMRDQSVSHCKT